MLLVPRVHLMQGCGVAVVLLLVRMQVLARCGCDPKAPAERVHELAQIELNSSLNLILR